MLCVTILEVVMEGTQGLLCVTILEVMMEGTQGVLCVNLGSDDGRYTRSAVFVTGPELMKTFSEELEYLEEKRHEYTNAEKLFELPITMYPELIRLQKDMKGLEAIFSIYTAQKVRIYTTVIMLSLIHI